jgi:solute carrier family 38 (sodium-coupled neutral amino acid transporter), member 11
MVAFCIIVGDTIPHVLAALFPSLSAMPFLWLLTNRHAVIVLFILGLSYPLSLYRDIAKVCSTKDFWSAKYWSNHFVQLAKASTLALISMTVIIVTVITQGYRVPVDMKGKLRGSILINDGIFQAIGVISFGACHMADW